MAVGTRAFVVLFWMVSTEAAAGMRSSLLSNADSPGSAVMLQALGAAAFAFGDRPAPARRTPGIIQYSEVALVLVTVGEVGTPVRR